MTSLAGCFDPPAEVVAEFSSDMSGDVRKGEADILRMIERRPCTLDDICAAFGMHKNEATKYLGKMTRTGQARSLRRNGDVYYSVAGIGKPEHANV
jgi:hypothetical protein